MRSKEKTFGPASASPLSHPGINSGRKVGFEVIRRRAGMVPQRGERAEE